MKVLHVNVVYPHGSTGKIVHEIVTYMGENNSFVCYGRGNKLVSKKVSKFCYELEAKVQGVINRLGGLQYGGNFFATKRLNNIIKRENPDIVHIHCINGYCVNIYKLLDFLAEKKIKTVITHHAEFYYTGSCSHAFECNKWTTNIGCNKCPSYRIATGCMFYDNSHFAWSKMYNAFNKFDNENLCFVAVSPWVKMRSLQSKIVNRFNCDVILNGVNTKVFHRECLSTQLNYINENDIICLHVTASFDTKKQSLKGGKYIVELAKRHPEYKFVVVSSHMNLTEKLPSNIILWGKAQSQEQLANLYRRADISIITSKRETFSMIVAESLCCGTPVIGFKAGGPESIAIEKYSSFVDYPNINELSNALLFHLNEKVNKLAISKEAIVKYASFTMVQEYLKVYNKLYNR